MILDKINQTNDIKKLKPEEYPLLAEEIRAFMVEKTSRCGGHLASNLGIVELTMALHLALDPEKDKIIWDVGHQCYTHKILTGRKNQFDRLRQYGGISGFPKKSESPCDIFDTGHSSTSISMGLGLAQARDLSGENYTVVSVIGDGSLSGGMAFEALNNASQLKSNFIIIINDNEMSISRNIGGMSRALQDLRTAPRYNKLKQVVKDKLDSIPDFGGRMVESISRAKSSIKQLFLPGMWFEDMDLTYLGPLDGYNIPLLVDAIRDARRLEKAVVLHVITKKGKGYAPAEQDPEHFHGIGPFDPESGKSPASAEKSYTDYAGEAILACAQEDPSVTAITAAMESGTGLKAFHRAFPDRFFDVGISEQHAVSFASGLAEGGMKPYVFLYSTFLQRAYDQIVHDVCLQNANVKFMIDRAGLVGADGETHHGMLDAGFLQTIPNLTILAPRDGYELSEMVRFSLRHEGPLAIRYPRGKAPEIPAVERSVIEYGKAEILRSGKDVVLWAAGSMADIALAAAEKLAEKQIFPTVVNARFLKPFDTVLLKELSAAHRYLIILEENNRSGALGQQISDYCLQEKLFGHILNTAPADSFIRHGSVNQLKADLELDTDSIVRRTEDFLRTGEEQS